MVKEIEWNKVLKDIEKINEIVGKCSENVQEKCFELLFNMQYGHPITETTSDLTKMVTKKTEKETKKEQTTSEYKLPGNVLAMLRKNGLTKDNLEKIYMLDHEPILPTYNIDTRKMATAQFQRTLMVLLENALTTGYFKAEYAEVRDTCKEEGVYDSNFTANLRAKAKYFRGPITSKSVNDTDVVELSGEGTTALAELIRELGQS